MEGCTFAPEINEISRQLTKQRASASMIGGSGGNSAAGSGASGAMDRGGSRGGGEDGAGAVACGLSVADRLEAWAEQREQRLVRQREIAKSKEFDGCTFQPNVNSAGATLMGAAGAAGVGGLREEEPHDRNGPAGGWYGAEAPLGANDLSRQQSSGRNVKQPAQSKQAKKASVKRSNKPHAGIDSFLERQRKGRELAEERRTVKHCTGASWTGKATKPVEFALRTEQRKSRDVTKVCGSMCTL
jgi:hypothetical protein